jgi:hypothetical protein
MTESPPDASLPGDPRLLDLACPDCIPVLVKTAQQGAFGPVTVVQVAHSPTCPWLKLVAPSGAAIVSTDIGILVHFLQPADGA